MIYNSYSQLIGNTPLLELTRIEHKFKLNSHILAKLEFFNPSGSVKDRTSNAILDDAFKKGLLNPDTVIIEPTSGNTGIALASAAAAKGFHLIIVMPDNMSIERKQLIEAYGAEVVLSDHSLGMKGAIMLAHSLAKKYKNSFIAGQFTNPANVQTHFDTTGAEIYRDTCGNIDAFVCGVGTGGTITGVGHYLKQKNPNINIVAVEPKASPFLSQGKCGNHKISGIGSGFIPDTLDTAVYDEIITVSDEDAFETTRLLAKTEGILTGISSGAALWASINIAKKYDSDSKTIVVLFADTGERYLSCQLFAPAR